VTSVYYLWVGLKDKAYTNRRWNKLRNITNITSQQFPDKNARVNTFCQYTECMSGQHYFQHLLWHGRVFIRLSKGYYHCDNLCSSLYLLLSLPRCGIRHKGAEGAPANRKWSILYCVCMTRTAPLCSLSSVTPFKYSSFFHCCMCVVASLILSGRLRFWVNLQTMRRQSTHINHIKNAHTTVYQCDWNVLAKGQFLENTATWSSMVRHPMVM